MPLWFAMSMAREVQRDTEAGRAWNLLPPRSRWVRVVSLLNDAGSVCHTHTHAHTHARTHTHTHTSSPSTAHTTQKSSPSTAHEGRCKGENKVLTTQAGSPIA